MTRLIELKRCADEGGTFVSVGGRELAVFRSGDDVTVIDNSCPHAGGNLSGGDMTDGVVECPWHNWRFDLRTGVCEHAANVRVARYTAAVRDGWVFAELPDGRSSPG
ncbi:MAG: Rieske 2Fe-2S domain-containing protein [Phycisphaerales bacterium]|nr:Rieske 2Fe-2S domain-containing protein [Phycisphaerales bacterium]